MVNLTAREHYIAHLLLFKQYSLYGTPKQAVQMPLAVRLLNKQSTKQLNKNLKIKRFKSREYASVKEAISDSMKGSGNPIRGKASGNRGKTHS